MFGKKKLKFMFYFIIVAILAFGVIWWYRDLHLVSSPVTYGVSFSPDYARYLKLEPKVVFRAILDDWKFKYVRLSAQWDEIENKKDNFDFSELDWLMNEAAVRKVKVVLVVGQKIPRWPECHLPAWATKLPEPEYRSALNNFIKRTVERYQNSPALEIWQVENEPLFSFGVCPAFNKQMLSDELALVKKIDSTHPTLVTDSGELSLWRGTATAADFFGTTMYRVVWNKSFGYFNYDWLPPSFYRAKLWLNGRDPGHAYVTELQAEPWITNQPIEQMPLADQYKSMNLARLKNNLNYAGQVGFPRAYLWGAEWWYWLNEKGQNEIPDFIATLNK